MRDHEGDKIAGVNTLPVLFDRKKIKAVVCLLLVSVSVFIVMFNISRLFVFLPFSFLSMVFLFRENYHFAHLSGSMGFVFLPFWLLII
jgi:4-hydroxybenzoate polyprenyltransferase